MAADQARQCLQDAVVGIREINASGREVGSDPGRSAFGELKVGVSKAGGDLGSLADEIMDDPSEVLRFVAAFSAAVRIYRHQAESVLERLLQASVRVQSAARADPSLHEALCATGAKVEALLGDSSGGAFYSKPGDGAAKALPAKRGSTKSTASAGKAPVEGKVVEGKSKEEPKRPTSGSKEDLGYAFSPWERGAAGGRAGEASSMHPTAGDAAAASAAAAAAAAAASAETRQMLRAGFQAIEKIDYEADGKAGRGDDALTAFNKLYTALNRAHWEYTREIRPTAEAMESPMGAGCGGGMTSPDGPARQQDVDILAEALVGVTWEPRRVLMFLFQLAKLRTLHASRINSAAQMLTQISPAYRDIARSDAYLTARLGACRGPGDPAFVVSYGFASSLRWLAWEASRYWVDVRRGKEKKAQQTKESWRDREASLKALSELPQEVLEKLLAAAWAAGAHTVHTRWPEESPGLIAWVVTAVSARQEDKGPYKDEFFKHFEDVKSIGALADDLNEDLRWMMWNTAWYVANKSKGYHREAREALVRSERHLQRAFRGEAQWRGVNLGGWFLLEPGPCTDFWENLPAEAKATTCEWDCCEALGRNAAKKLLSEHRRTYFRKEDFMQIRAAGLSHVRLPFGAWCVNGPREGEPYVGPCLEDLDRALDSIEAAGLRVVLDMHGGVGGENDEAPCGRLHKEWHPRHWDSEASLFALRIVAERYANRACVCGIGVANEPSERIPANQLARYYEAAISTVRQAGMRAGEVALLLPIFTEGRTSEFLQLWEDNYPMYDDCVFDLHFYQCFGRQCESWSVETHMKKALERESVLRSLPMCCVSEWSLSFPDSLTASMDEKTKMDNYRRFAKAQLEAYETATHGWFFWTWKDSYTTAWNLRDCLKEGLLRVPDGGRSSTVVKP